MAGTTRLKIEKEMFGSTGTIRLRLECAWGSNGDQGVGRGGIFIILPFVGLLLACCIACAYFLGTT